MKSRTDSELKIELLNAKRHQRDSFTCGEISLDNYLQQYALQHHRAGISSTHVLVATKSPGAILGFYSLSAAQLLLTEMNEADRKKLPRYPVPAIRMGRLAVATNEQDKGHGEYLLADAVARCINLREQLGVHVLLVDALHDKAAMFYQAYGFRFTTSEAQSLYLPLGKI